MTEQPARSGLHKLPETPTTRRCLIMSGMDKLSEAGPTDRAVSRSNLSRRWCREPGTLPVHLRLSFVSTSQAARPMCGHSGHLAKATDPINQAPSSSPAVAAGAAWVAFHGRRERAKRARERRGSSPTRRLLLFLPIPFLPGLPPSTLLVSCIAFTRERLFPREYFGSESVLILV